MALVLSSVLLVLLLILYINAINALSEKQKNEYRNKINEILEQYPIAAKNKKVQAKVSFLMNSKCDITQIKDAIETLELELKKIEENNKILTKRNKDYGLNEREKSITRRMVDKEVKNHQKALQINKHVSNDGYRDMPHHHPNAHTKVIINNESTSFIKSSINHKKEEERLRLNSLNYALKPNSSTIKQYLHNAGVSYFYHFTDRRNLASIREHGGLFSWKYCEDHEITIPYTGGSDFSRSLDRNHGLADYVRLSFCDDHPMAWRKHNEGSSLVLLYVDIEVAAFKETLFTDRNAASSSFSCGGEIEDLQRVNIAATQRNYVSRDEGEIFFQHQAECMIKTFIPLRYITNIDNPRKMRF